MAAQNDKNSLLNTVPRIIPVSIDKVKLYVERAPINQTGILQNNNILEEDIQSESDRLNRTTNQFIQTKKYPSSNADEHSLENELGKIIEWESN